MIRQFFLLLLVTSITTLAANTLANDSLNILVYHHVAEDTPASTSVSPETFRAHLELLRDNGFNVVDLASALESIKNRQPIAENAVAITFDDGYLNLYTNALPMLLEFGYTATFFIATDSIDKNYGNMMSWENLRTLQSSGMTVANHTSNHDYLVRYPVRDGDWRAALEANIVHAQNRLNEELEKSVPKWLAYPYGEFSEELTTLVTELNYIGFGQHSGGVWHGSNWQALPRFAASGIYANTNTLLTKLRSRPMRVNETTLVDMLTSSNQPEVEISLVESDDLNKSLNCFINGSAASYEWRSEDSFFIQSDAALSDGRHRYNCTSRSLSGNFYYWFSKPWLVYSGHN